MPVFRLTPETATLYAAVLAIFGSLLGGWIGARATLRAMRESIRATERIRAETQETERLSALKALDRELRMNLAIAEKPQADRAWVPFQHAALDAAQPYLLTLPDTVHGVIQEARLALSRYNTLAVFLNHEGDPAAMPEFGENQGGVFPDTGGVFANLENAQRRRNSGHAADNLAQEAKQPLQTAISALEAVLSSTPAPSGAKSTPPVDRRWRLGRRK